LFSDLHAHGVLAPSGENAVRRWNSTKKEGEPQAMKRLTLSSTDRKIAGVCGGIGEYFNVDPTMIRLGVVLLGLLTAVIPMLIAYLLAWFIIPAAHS
jgi:phage shock protein C